MSNVTESKAPTRIPDAGVDRDALLDRMRAMRADDADWRRGRTWSLVYHAGDAHQAFLKAAHNLFFSENGLNPIAFKSLKTMEADVVRMTAAMLHGDAKTVGTMTSGGTESILLAVKAYRDRARRHRPWILRPEIVAPKTVHVAFDKAAHYFGLRIRHAPVGDDFRVDVRAMKRLIGRNTVMIAASAPQYPHGVIDPIEEIGALALEAGLPFHIDACIGGFVLPWVERLGYPLPMWDFRVSGVTSISADLHKYGYSAKGASTITYRSMNDLKHQFFVSTDWPGGIYASPSMPGTRPGGAIAAAWAAMQALGESGYIELTRQAMEGRDALRTGIEAIDGLRVLGAPHATLVAWASCDAAVDTYAVADQLEVRGWTVDRQQHPACIHCTVAAHHVGVIDEYLADLRASVEFVRAHPGLESQGNAAMYGMMAKVPFRRFVKLSVSKVMEGMYGPEGTAPDLSKLGQGADDGRLLAAIAKYGEPAMALLGRVDDARRWVRSALFGSGGG